MRSFKNNNPNSLLKKWKKRFLYFFLFLTIACCTLFTFNPNSDYKSTDYFESTLLNIDRLKIEKEGDSILKVGWSKKEIVPETPQRLIGYGLRKPYEEIKDSTFVRCVYVENANTKCAILSYDLLIVHPDIKKKLERILKQAKNTKDIKLYFGCTHTHNSYGGWSSEPIGKIIMGGFNEETFNKIIRQSMESILEAKKTCSNGSVGLHSFHLPEYIHNRIEWGGEKNDIYEIIGFKKTNGDKAIINFYGAHATEAPFRSPYLSGDFPAYVNKTIDSSGYFSMYLASGVASHSTEKREIRTYEDVIQLGTNIGNKALKEINHLQYKDSVKTSFGEFNVGIPPPALKITNEIIIRPYIFNYLFGHPKAHIDFLKINNILLTGLPADYSGHTTLEINDSTKNLQLKPIFSSFNGAYIGYLSKDVYYTCSNSETRTTNWYGPQNTNYFRALLIKLLNKIEKLNE